MKMPCHITDGWPRTPESKSSCGYQCVICYDNTATEDEEVCEKCQAEIWAEENGLETGMKRSWGIWRAYRSVSAIHGALLAAG